MNPGRLESFSDGVFAIAATLLVLNIHVPSPDAVNSLGHELAAQWPAYAAYVVSFATIGIIWINHHMMIRRLRAVDHPILTLNLALLLTVGVLPFTTALMATYLKIGHGQTLAAIVYAGSFLLLTLVFAAANHHILFPKAYLLEPPLERDKRSQIFGRGVSGAVPYAVAVAVAPLSAYATLAICGAVAVFYALPAASATGAAPQRG
jgi:uncharacterized membrane protein